MKLIIDIDDEMVCNDIKYKALEPTTATDEVIIHALYNGIPYEDKKVAYICDGTACDPERASCKRGGPCHHTTQIEHAKHFFKLEGADGWFEVDKTSEVNDG